MSEGIKLLGFKVISVKYAPDSTSSQQIFVKEHSLRLQEDDKPAGRTLFVLNLPPYVEQPHLKALFSSVGKITNVILNNQTAYVVFSTRDGLLKALQTTHLELKNVQFKTGLERMIDNYNKSFVAQKILSEEVNKFMQNYDKTESKQKKLDSKEMVDDEGWTVVAKKGRRPGLANKESVKLKITEKIVMKNKKKELKNFYTFQIKESKMKNLATLRKNYEDAKKKVNLMKNVRRFKPY